MKIAHPKGQIKGASAYDRFARKLYFKIYTYYILFITYIIL